LNCKEPERTFDIVNAGKGGGIEACVSDTQSTSLLTTRGSMTYTELEPLSLVPDLATYSGKNRNGGNSGWPRLRNH
jgi:hypothetical protein